jgi:glycerol-3-phosphate cytidylyltransferase-like family protein
VFINDDEYLKQKKSFVVTKSEERAYIIRSLSSVNDVIIYSGDNEHKSIMSYKINKLWRFGPQSRSIMFHSPEFIGRNFVPGKGIVDEIIYTPFYDGLSSTSDIMERISKYYKPKNKIKKRRI